MPCRIRETLVRARIAGRAKADAYSTASRPLVRDVNGSAVSVMFGRPPATTITSSSAISSNPEFSLGLPLLQCPHDLLKDVMALSSHHKNLFGVDDFPESKITAEVSPSAQNRLPPLPQRKLTLKDAERLLTAFQKISAFFPFVQVAEEATVPSLSRTSPFLLLAILTTASFTCPQVCHQLDHEFKRVLSSKVIVEGRKSLDLLQGLLVYIAWYPLYVNPKKNQSFMYMNIATSLVTDLGLDRELPNLSGFSTISTEGLIDGCEFTQAARHAYLGAYYLSTALSMGFQKPNNLPYRNLMDIHIQTPTKDENTAVVYSLIKLQRLTERISEVYETKTWAADPHTGAFHAELNIQIFLNELQEWRNSTSDEIRNLPFNGLAERFIDVAIYGHELGFLSRSYRNSLNQPDRIAPTITPHLPNCLAASKIFFEYLLSLPESSFKSFTTVQGALMVQAILILSRLTFLMASSLGWDANTTRANIPLVMYLDCLCYRFQQLSSTIPKDSEIPENPDLFYVFRMILGSVKKSYEQRVADIQTRSFAVDHGNAVVTSRGHCPIRDPSLGPLFTSVEDSMYGDSFSLNPSEYSGVAFGSTQTPYHDLWATMSCSWANEFSE
ncbi:uncharacterized protein BP5553_10407 [Venustampulla echinocandica]|uniref:Uncharacterized protein n=1 Tax=Venustampulla echinocandica TaxID=2656787 RepID=A0A370T997_9HELO|nr:uncharacterized protein BP5553_10407 [Venustampulla echinocandica]RDL30129.1 hypothetical protein BP5553_10407 [Venustampulla echinocandica]